MNAMWYVIGSLTTIVAMILGFVAGIYAATKEQEDNGTD